MASGAAPATVAGCGPTSGLPESTLARLFHCATLTHANQVAMRRKKYGIWNQLTWADSFEEAKQIGLGMLASGLSKGDRVGLLGDNEPELYWALLGTWCVGGVGCGIWVDVNPAELKYYLQHSHARFVVARDQEQVDKLLTIAPELPELVKIIWWNAKGMNAATYKRQTKLVSLDSVRELGRQYGATHHNAFENAIEAVSPDDPACIYYTSGTAGAPKGLLRSHRAQIDSNALFQRYYPFAKGDDMVCYLQLACFAEPFVGSVSHLTTGTVLNFVESHDTMLEDMREISPACVFWFPRWWEDLATRVQSRSRNAGWLRRSVLSVFLPVGFRVADAKMKGQRVGILSKTLHRMGWWLAFRPILDQAGLLRTRWGITSFYVLGDHTYRFLRAIGVDMRHVYATAEAGLIATDIPGKTDPRSVGTLAEGVMTRLSPGGELLVRNDRVFSGYLEESAETQNCPEQEGWLQTGDICSVGDDGVVCFAGSVSEAKCLLEDREFSPQLVEARLRFGGMVKDALVLRNSSVGTVAALLTVDSSAVAKWAEKNRIPYTTFTDLSQRDEVGALALEDVVRVNKDLRIPERIKRYAILPRDFDPEEGELTRNRKIRRVFLKERYRDLVSALYSDNFDVHVEAKTQNKIAIRQVQE